MSKIKRISSLLLILVLCICTIVPASAASKVKLNKTKATITVGETLKLQITGTSKKVTWTTSNKRIATVSKGKVTAKKEGKVTITAKVNKLSLTCKVTVTKKQNDSCLGIWDVYEMNGVKMADLLAYDESVGIDTTSDSMRMTFEVSEDKATLTWFGMPQDTLIKLTKNGFEGVNDKDFIGTYDAEKDMLTVVGGKDKMVFVRR